jgi:hemolysin III
MFGYINQLYSHLSLDEKANVITHGFGLVVAICFTPVLLASENVYLPYLGLCVFSFGMIAMFFCSTFYHLANKDVRKNRWRILDHLSIFILIGSTYTPFILFYFHTDAGMQFLLLHWIIILFGIGFKLVFQTKYEIVSLSLYLILGWMVLFIYKDITYNMADSVRYWLLGGGISYTIGVYFYVKTHLAWHHAIWHIFVILGCAFHWIALYLS